MDADGFPHISYYDASNDDLKYATLYASGWYTQTVDSEGYVGLYTSLALDADGFPHISYYDSSNNDLKYALGPVSDSPPTPTPTLPAGEKQKIYLPMVISED